jgi:O-acetyl-ADP-ribose deacetylase (regulator of RNase III)
VDEKTTVFKFTNGSLKVTIKQGDLSKEVCDAIVNPTNTCMRPTGGLDTMLHQTMGDFFKSQVNAISSELQENACPVGNSRIFISKPQRDPNVARFIINTVGSNYRKEGKDLASFHLQSCYCTSLALANSYGLSSIAYPAISCGAYHFPPNEAAQVGIETIRAQSYQVKDVRFVLFERHIYEAFVREWTDYSEKINRQANVIEDRDRSRTPPPSRPSPTLLTRLSARFCTFCKEQQLSADQEQLCTQCLSLSRSEFFNRLLQQLCFAAEKSFDELTDKCNVLKPILSSYPLIYTPAQVFDQSIHKRDLVAEHYLQTQCDRRFRNGMPMAVLGDGNCFYNTFVKLGGAGTTTEVTTVTPVELRARNIIELTLNIEEYQRKYPSFELILDSFQKYIREEMVHDANYVSVWDLFSIPTVLNIKVISIYPKVNGADDIYYQTINGKEFEPLANTQSTSLTEVRLLFSHCNKPIHLGTNAKDWTPNHYVPVLNLR